MIDDDDLKLLLIADTEDEVAIDRETYLKALDLASRELVTMRISGPRILFEITEKGREAVRERTEH